MARIRDLDGNYIDVPRGDQAGTDLSPLMWNGTALVQPATPANPFTLMASTDPNGTAGGAVALNPGDMVQGGYAQLTGGDAATGEIGGHATIAGGAGDGGNNLGGSVNAQGGTANGYGAGVDISTSDAFTSSGHPGGDVTVYLGMGDGAGRRGLIIVTSLPTADPGVAGALWSNSGVVTVSAG